jgi:Zn-dependent peptidase ImmA (M78 family)
MRMQYEKLPITPAIITWARARAGLSLQEATQTFKRIQAWENGEAFPTYHQLEQIANAFKVPVAVFFFPEPPSVPSISETFRTLPEAEYERIPSRILLLLRKAKALQLDLMELTEGHNPSARLITRDLQFPTNVGLSEMTESVRNYLRVSVDEQLGVPDDDAALKLWRQKFLDVGIFVFKDAFRVDEYSGFCLYDDNFPIIYVNNSSAKTKQIFTLFHELAHLIFQTSGIDTVHSDYVARLADDARRVEIICNRFAAEILLPEAAFSAARRGQATNEETAERIARSFHVSREVVFRRFLDHNLIDQAAYTEAVDRWNRQREPGGSGGDYYWTKLAYLGRDYVGLALRQYRQNRISQAQLAEYLDTKPKNLAGIEDYFAKGAA